MSKSLVKCKCNCFGLLSVGDNILSISSEALITQQMPQTGMLQYYILLHNANCIRIYLWWCISESKDTCTADSCLACIRILGLLTMQMRWCRCQMCWAAKAALSQSSSSKLNTCVWHLKTCLCVAIVTERFAQLKNVMFILDR